MPILEEILNLALGSYNADAALRASRVEYGHVLYRRGDALLAGERVTSPDGNTVVLYDLAVNLRVVGADDEFEGAYMGDFHTHPPGESWMSQFPSPSDVTSVSVVNDLWPNGLNELLYLAPKIQVVQGLLFGDLFVLAPTQDRTRFASFAEQDAELGRVLRGYSAAHLKGNDRHGAIPRGATPGQFDAVVADVLPALVRALRGRAEITFVPNVNGAARQVP